MDSYKPACASFDAQTGFLKKAAALERSEALESGGPIPHTYAIHIAMKSYNLISNFCRFNFDRKFEFIIF